MRDLGGLGEHSSVAIGIKSASTLSSGAELHKCALQVNPYGYLARHAKPSKYLTEDEYNAAIIDACKANGISVIGITDHFRVATSVRIAEMAEGAGITAFLGFEANSSEGVHILCLFPREMSVGDIELFIGSCGVTSLSEESPLATKTCDQILEMVRNSGGVALAAHVCSTSGLLTTLRGQSRQRVWRSEHLAAACLPGSRDDAPLEHRQIIKNDDPAHKRERAIAVVNANDVSDPADLARASCSTFVRMSKPSIEGLRQAFLDWESRIRLHTDPPPVDRVELLAASWEGGLLDGQTIRFNSALNALVGGRGAGKSTVIESLRYALGLQPAGKEAGRSHSELIKGVLKPGTKISVLLFSPNPSPELYLIERLVPNQPVVRNNAGIIVSGLTPADVIPNVECYGQHEISELTRSPQHLAQLLHRFVDAGSPTAVTKSETLEKLHRSQERIAQLVSRLHRAEDDIAGLPPLRERLERFDAAGLGRKLNDKAVIDQEARELDTRKSQIDQIEIIVDEIAIRDLAKDNSADLVPVRQGLLDEAQAVVQSLEVQLTKARKIVADGVIKAREDLSAIWTRWQAQVSPMEEIYAQTLRDLQKEGVSGADYISTRSQIAELRKREIEVEQIGSQLRQERRDRSALVTDWEDAKAADLRALERAARKVGKQLEGRVRVTAVRGGSLAALDAVIRATVSGQGSAAAIEKLRTKGELSLPDLASYVRGGASALSKAYGFTASFCERLAAGGDAVAMQIEEIELPLEANLELNVADESAPENWKKLDDLSTGQKATAVLLLLLLGSDEPLIVDQPEDDLDNRFISEVVVPTMRKEKKRRQFIFSTHNANIPVLADAEQIIGLTPVVEGGTERTEVRPELVGSIDAMFVSELVGTLLEGGKRAFDLRRRKYGF